MPTSLYSQSTLLASIQNSCSSSIQPLLSTFCILIPIPLNSPSTTDKNAVQDHQKKNPQINDLDNNRVGFRCWLSVYSGANKQYFLANEEMDAEDDGR
jgi:hypothetical protein